MTRNVSCIGQVKYIRRGIKGDKGNRGAVFRQHTAFVSGSYDYQSGADSEEFIDVVRSDSGVWYRCIKSYNSASTPAANNLSNTAYWSTSGMANMTFVATELLLAQNATINMMGTNEINLYDENSNMFGSFRVPHGDDNSVDGGKYSLWLGAKSAKDAPFSVTNEGDMVANSGKIGPFWISPAAYKDSLVSGTFEKDPDTSRFTSYVKLSKSLIELVGKYSFASDVVSGGGFERIQMSVDRAKIDGYMTPLYIKSEGNASIPETAGVVVDAIGAFSIGSARAFWARKGSYAGFKRDVYSLEQASAFNAGKMCCDGYGLVFMRNTDSVTITLPLSMDGLEIGSELIIIKGSKDLVFKGSRIYQCRKGLVSGSITATAMCELIHLYYAGSTIGWFLNFESA